MQMHGLLKQYWGAVSFIYRDKEKQFFPPLDLVGEYSSENVVVDISITSPND